jgi:hypothetical protein
MGPLVKLVSRNGRQTHQCYVQNNERQPTRLRHLPRQIKAQQQDGERQNADVSHGRNKIVSADVSRVNVVHAKGFDQAWPNHRSVLGAIGVGGPMDHSGNEVTS